LNRPGHGYTIIHSVTHSLKPWSSGFLYSKNSRMMSSTEPDFARTGLFISHAHEDADLALHVKHLLRQALQLDHSAITCTSDRSLPAGEELKAEIQRRLASAKALVLLSTRNSKAKDWVKYEYAFAEGRDVKVYVAVPTTGDEYNIPNQQLGNIYVPLDDEREVKRFILDLRKLYETPGEPTEDDLNEAIDLVTTSTKRTGDLETRKRNFRTTVLVASILLAVAAGSIWYLQARSRDMNDQLNLKDIQLQAQEEELRALKEGGERTEFEKINSMQNAAFQQEIRRFSLQGKVFFRGEPVRQGSLIVYKGQNSLLNEKLDDDGTYAFNEGDLDVDPREAVDFEISHEMLGAPKRKTVIPRDATLNIDLN
jgi:hypothetical protein